MLDTLATTVIVSGLVILGIVLLFNRHSDEYKGESTPIADQLDKDWAKLEKMSLPELKKYLTKLNKKHGVK